MRRKPLLGSTTEISGSGSSRKSHFGRMQCSGRWLLLGLFLCAYTLLTIHLLSLDHECPDLQGLVLREENKDFLKSLEWMANQVNQSGSDISISGPLAKLGIKFPLAAPPVNTAEDQRHKPAEHVGDVMPVSKLLQSNYAPNNVFYIWCGRRWFEFQHYLSVMSVVRLLQPDTIIFFYDEQPVVDSWSYNTWFTELKENYPFFRLWQMDANDKAAACTGFSNVNVTFIENLISYRGGMYVHENTIFSMLPAWFRNQSIVNGFDMKTRRGFVFAQKGLTGHGQGWQITQRRADLNILQYQCTSISQYVKAHRKPNCVNIEATFFPKDIWELDNSFGKLVRRIFYGDGKINRPAQSFDVLIPNIAHIVWLGGGKMDFLFYLCALSLLHVAEVEQLYIHGDAPPTGEYWERIKNHERLNLIKRDYPGTIYGTRVDVISHVTDIWRVDFMVKYGGIYVDTDTVFVKPLDRDIRAYDAVGAYDWTYWNHPFPDTINFGVAIGKRNAVYWHKFQESMKWFMDNDWSWNGLRQPYRIKERHPELVKIDPHLQIICFEAKCHPTWWPNYHNESIHHLNSPSTINWREDAYAFHWTLPTPFELLNEDNLYKSNTMFAEIGKHILKKAGKLPDDVS